ncbi:hypothetical protein H5410_011463 [Solanum commersonii]|uniref:Uncharacterized protein n=1 Tax=Solanum commersonii TaxID=4109 RepID=A0A9J6ANP6_SOLCO|nr:hypothetical protein H5410_011463 [Solanum commersonii]
MERKTIAPALTNSFKPCQPRPIVLVATKWRHVKHKEEGIDPNRPRYPLIRILWNLGLSFRCSWSSFVVEVPFLCSSFSSPFAARKKDLLNFIDIRRAVFELLLFDVVIHMCLFYTLG